MKRAFDIARMTFISFELLWTMVVVTAGMFYPETVSAIGEQLSGNPDLWKALYTIPLGLTVYAFIASYRMRAPLNKQENRALYNWPGYQRLVDRVFLSMVLCVISSVGTLSIWIFQNEITSLLLGVLFLIFCGVPAIVVFLLIISEQRLKEILTKHS